MDNPATMLSGYHGIQHVCCQLELFYSHPENLKVGLREAISKIVSSMEPDGEHMLMNMFFLSAYIKDATDYRIKLENMNRHKKEQG